MGFRVWAIMRTFAVVNIGRYFDCVSSLSDSMTCLHNTVFNFAPIPFRQALELWGVPGFEVMGIPRVVVIALVLIAVVSVNAERGVDVRERVLKLHPVLRVALYLVCILIVIYQFDWTVRGGGTFLYANF